MLIRWVRLQMPPWDLYRPTIRSPSPHTTTASPRGLTESCGVELRPSRIGANLAAVPQFAIVASYVRHQISSLTPPGWYHTTSPLPAESIPIEGALASSTGSLNTCGELQPWPG